MKKHQIGAILAIMAGFMITTSAGGTTLRIEPQQQSAEIGDLVVVDVMATGLFGTQIGTYDFGVTWDPGLLTFSAIAFDIFLGPASLQDFEISAGRVDVAEVGLGGLPNQDGFTEFRLFSLTMEAVAAGTSALDLLGNIPPDGGFLGNQFGLPIRDVLTESGRITVFAVSEPATLALLLAGLLALRARRDLRRG